MPAEHSRLTAERPAILQIIPRLDAGGAERTTVDIARALVHAGYRALVVSEGGRLEHELIGVGARVIEMKVASKNPLTMWRNSVRIARLIREEKIALVHARSRGPAWSAYYAARATRVPFVTTYHGIYKARTFLKRWYNAIMARGDRVIANSQWTARHITATHKVPSGRMVIIPRGVDLTAFDITRVTAIRVVAMRARWGVPNDARVVLLPGRLTRWKGQLVLIAAVAALVKAGRWPSDAYAVLAGDAQGRSDYLAEIAAARKAAGLEGIVVVSDHVDDMPAAYAAADIIVSPSTEPEAFGRVPVEAAAMGRPVIATAHGGVEETVLRDESGLLVPPRSVRALSEALAALLAAPQSYLNEMGARGRRHIETVYTVERMCDATLRVYAELLQTRKNQRL